MAAVKKTMARCMYGIVFVIFVDMISKQSKQSQRKKITMTPTRAEIANAAQKSLDENWLPRSRGEISLIGCALCLLLCSYYLKCASCPLHDKGKHCCREYEDWNNTEYGSEEEMTTAKAICKRLLDIVAEYSEEG